MAPGAGRGLILRAKSCFGDGCARADGHEHLPRHALASHSPAMLSTSHAIGRALRRGRARAALSVLIAGLMAGPIAGLIAGLIAAQCNSLAAQETPAAEAGGTRLRI